MRGSQLAMVVFKAGVCVCVSVCVIACFQTAGVTHVWGSHLAEARDFLKENRVKP